MKKLLLILLPLVFMFGCSLSMLEKYTGTDEIEVPNDRGAVSLMLPGSQNRAATQADVQSYQVTLSGIDVVYNNSIIGLPGETLLFEKLMPGNYTVTVDAYDAVDPDDAASSRIFTGSTNVMVVAGQVTKAIVQLQYIDGSVEIEIVFPEEPGSGEPTGTEELDQSQTEIQNICAETYYYTGQVFTAGITGELTKIELLLGYDDVGPPDQEVYVILHDGADIYGMELGSSAHELLSAPGSDWITFALDNVNIVAGNQYTIEIRSEDAIQVLGHDGEGGDVYPGGYAIWYGSQQVWDFAFRTYVYH